ncbi:MAG: hypothetical protein FWE05_05580 [Defluviitaleaceae bacterium]|nr:hypothetical protein [Defluviitaleaceae bacterium]
MENYGTRGIDDLGRLVVPQSLRTKLNFEQGMQIVLMPLEPIIILKPLEGEPSSDYFISEIDELGRIALDFELRNHQNWKEQDKIAFYLLEDILIIKKPL